MRIRVAVGLLIVAAALLLGALIADHNRKGAERLTHTACGGKACVCSPCSCCKACCGE